MDKKKAEKEMGFEESLARLEQITAEMEGGKLSLDDMIARFEEGQTLLKFCNQKLNEVERRIEKLVRKGDELVTEPLDDGGEERAGGLSGAGASVGELF